MKALDVQSRLEFARAGASVLRALALVKATIRYADFATAIGLKREGERWEVWHRKQVSDILLRHPLPHCRHRKDDRQEDRLGTSPIRSCGDRDRQPGRWRSLDE
jgi:hypothetical protein